ncbi:LamG-like jellyroll fold domain-containing protein [Crocosphaera sp. XPORK-15E]|uniref:LamG-like jellyroll fold domain-containing protein n=1 Tax=Crocosphaera sp. XPORK-15E TaxID=3110247 RepID=UPI002B211043|nr:LamG-like jellyroll fold domain-containing protein [Crocosphaera sp. XPORK-15E]MEA5532392.1 LamG-like jellyroll fold domain-containing protein [Crocosphaera sp. XPORK-15E]
MANVVPVLYFDGDEDYIKIPDSPSLRILNYTVELWLKTDGIPNGWVGVFGKVNFNYNLWLCYLGQIGHNWHTTQSAKAISNTSENIVKWDQWQHIAITNDGKVAKIFINGELITKSSVDGSLVADNTELIIGAGLTGEKGQYYKGYLTEIRLWNKARSADEIKADMYHRLTGNENGLVGYWPLTTAANNVAVDKTSSNNNGKIYGAVFQNAQLPGQLSVEPAVATVEISDLFYKAKADKKADQYVEITNNGTAVADLSGWKIKSLAKSLKYIFPVGIKLNPGQSIKVYNNEYHPESGGFLFFSEWGVWKNKGDTATLLDSKGNEVSTFSIP